MCGIAGMLAFGSPEPQARLILRTMTDAISHRGPDDSGHWIDGDARVALGHRRLAIIDLTDAGHQPMTSHSGRYVIVYNGEIYNYRDLRATLGQSASAPAWRGHSDTEVILACFDRWGIRKTLESLNGMFAFAVWDRQTRHLTLARDRLGEKPLYYGLAGNTFVFASELKGLIQHPDFRRDIDREALTLFLRYSYVPAPRSIWQNVSKLSPAHFVVVDERGAVIERPTPYWNFEDRARDAIAHPLKDERELVDQVETLLKDAVLRRMEADVPLGAFLSGGIDSSLIVALMQAQSQAPIRTFTIGFDEKAYDEAHHARAVAAHLGTEHTEWRIGPSEIADVVPRLPTMYDEPFADSSQIPTHLVSALTKRHVTVSLSGDGGDELFGGYNRYVTGLKFLRLGRRLGPARGLAAGFLKSRTGLAAVSAAMKFAPTNRRHANLVDRLPKVGYALEADTAQALYGRLVSIITNPADLVIGGTEPVDATGVAPALGDVRHDMMYLDTITYLPDDILAKVDRASMAVSLEARVPFLDHRIVELAWRLPLSAKFRDGQGKHILREILYRHVPRALVERPKTGFGVPISAWLSNEMRGWAEDLLDERTLRADGFFQPDGVRDLWKVQLVQGGRHFQLWNILMAQAWLREYAAPKQSATGALAMSA